MIYLYSIKCVLRKMLLLTVKTFSKQRGVYRKRKLFQLQFSAHQYVA